MTLEFDTKELVAVSITATGPGNVKTPIGTQTRVGTEKYSLTPAPREEC